MIGKPRHRKMSLFDREHAMSSEKEESDSNSHAATHGISRVIWLELFVAICAITAFASGFILLAIAARFDGNAIVGRILAGHYFFVGKHGKLTEVPQRVWNYSYISLLVFAVSFSLSSVGMLIRERIRHKSRRDSGA